MATPTRGEDFAKMQEVLRHQLEITKEECWLFTGGSRNNFHGTIYYNGKSWQTHRLVWTLIKGKIPDGLFVLHKCDIGMCVNPLHLFLGTQRDNIADMDAKGRSNRPQPGLKNGRAILSEEEVFEIRRLASEGIAPIVIYRKYDIGLTTIHKIINRKIWRHI